MGTGIMVALMAFNLLIFAILITGTAGLNCLSCVQVASDFGLANNVISDKIREVMAANYTDIIFDGSCNQPTSNTHSAACQTACFSLTSRAKLNKYGGPNGPPAILDLEGIDVKMALGILSAVSISIRGCEDRFFTDSLRVNMSSLSGKVPGDSGCLHVSDSAVFNVPLNGDICHCTGDLCNNKAEFRDPNSITVVDKTALAPAKFSCYKCKSFTEFPQISLPYEESCTGSPKSVVSCSTNCYTVGVGAVTTSYNGPKDVVINGVGNETMKSWTDKLNGTNFAARGCMDSFWSYLINNVTSVPSDHSCFNLKGGIYGMLGSVKFCVCNGDKCNGQLPMKDSGAEQKYSSLILYFIVISCMIF